MAPRPPAAPASAQNLALGVIGRAHGIRGEAVFRLFNPDGTRLEDLDFPLEVELVRPTGSRSATLVAARAFQQGALVRFAGIDSPEAAAALTNAEIHVPRSVLDPLEPGEFYVADLIGCAVVDGAGQARGTVEATFWNGMHDVLTIKAEDGSEFYLPAVGDFLAGVDLESRRIVIDDHE